MKPEQFVPQYDDTVTETNTMSGLTNPIQGKGYALLSASANVMAKMLNDNGMPVTQFNDNPWAVYGPLVFNHTVPWFKFSNGAERNAGTLATYWGMPGVNPLQVLDYVKADVDTPVGV
jgi:hypothetical protein